MCTLPPFTATLVQNLHSFIATDGLSRGLRRVILRVSAYVCDVSL
jgi:hypothetical protein